MKAQDYLKQIERLDRLIQNKLSEINQLRTMATSVSVVPKEINVQTTSENDKMANFVSKIYDIETEIGKIIDLYINQRKIIISQIEQIEDTNMYHVLFERYVSRKELNNIAIEMGYSFKQICRIHGNALNEFDNKFSKKYEEIIKTCPPLS